MPLEKYNDFYFTLPVLCLVSLGINKFSIKRHVPIDLQNYSFDSYDSAESNVLRVLYFVTISAIKI